MQRPSDRAPADPAMITDWRKATRITSAPMLTSGGDFPSTLSPYCGTDWFSAWPVSTTSVGT